MRRENVGHMKKYLLFDLDGTVTDSMPGITNSVAYALHCLGIREEDRSRLIRFVGPPLLNSFMEFYGLSHEQAWEGIRLYREYYEQKGIYENAVYEGMPELLRACRRAGKKVILATSKPWQYAKQILQYFDLDSCFDDVQGSSMDETKVTKQEVIGCALQENKIEDVGDAVMIGDRKQDVEGAKVWGMESIGVLFGYGGREELEKCGADYIAATVKELEVLLLGKNQIL